MATETEYYSPFIQETFSPTMNKTVREEYRERIKNIYYKSYEILRKMKDDESKELIELERKVIDENTKKIKPKSNNDDEIKKKELEQQKNNENNDENKDNNNNDKKINNDNNDEKKDDIKNNDDSKNDEKKDENNDDNDEEAKKPIELKKMERALDYLDNRYFGREHDFYVWLCKKYNITTIKNEYQPKRYFPPKISEVLCENELIKCFECQQDFIKSEFPNDEWRNGYFLACNRCAPDRNNIVSLKWNEQFKSSPEITLEHNAFVAKIMQNGHRSACIDMKSCKNGTHCFRWKTRYYQSWIMWGIGVPQKYPNNSYSSQKTYGIAGSNQTYKNGVCQYNVQTNQFFGGKSEVYIDMLLDLNKGELRFVIPGLNSEAKITGININEPMGYVPHVNMHYSGVTVQIKKIPVNWFGKNPNRVKFQY